jgi:SAM-dependent methyltransferase
MPVDRHEPPAASLRELWESNAAAFIAWARKPGHDSYWRFHREQFLEIVPEPGRLTVDIGCGEGRLSRELSSRGHTVVGVDSSPTMVDHARQADPTIEVHLADATRIPLEDGAADLAIAFMSYQDVDDMPGAIAESARILEDGGRLCLAIVHPLNSAGLFADDDPTSPFIITGSYLGAKRYEDTVERNGLAVTFASEHRPLSAYADAMWEAGLLIERLREPAMPDHAVRAAHDVRWQRVPLFLHIRAVRTARRDSGRAA